MSNATKTTNPLSAPFPAAKWVLAVVCASAMMCAASACVGIPNQYVCVTLSDNAANYCGPAGWPLPTGPSQGFVFLMDDGRGGGPQSAMTFTVNVPSRPITFELVPTPPTNASAPGGGYGCHPFAIVSADIIGGCSRRGIGCALGPQSGVSGSIPAHVAGAKITITPEINITYAYQSTYDTYMGGNIVISNQPPLSPASTTTTSDDGSNGSSWAAGPIAGVVVAIAVVLVLFAWAGFYARRHGYWTGCCKWNTNPNLAATAGAGGSSSSVAPATVASSGTTKLSPGDSSAPGGSSGSGGVAIEVHHIALKDDSLPFPTTASTQQTDAR